MAAKQVSFGKVRVNGVKVSKPATSVGPGDTLTFPQEHDIRVVEIIACGARRGPATEAQTLYLDKSPPPERREKPVAKSPGFEGKGRPTKKDRRTLDLSRRPPVE